MYVSTLLVVIATCYGEAGWETHHLYQNDTLMRLSSVLENYSR